MAHSLLKAGHSLSVYDLNQRAVQLLVDTGARAAASPGEAAKDADYVITMLPTSVHVCQRRAQFPNEEYPSDADTCAQRSDRPGWNFG